MNSQRRIFLAVSALVLLFACQSSQLLPADGGEFLPADGAAEMEESRYVALTFDDGPTKNTRRLLDGLLERGASATFFLVGEQIAGNEDLVRRMKAEGHQVGNHTWDHKRLRGMKMESVRQEVSRTDAAIQEVLGEGDYWVRPPYGILDKSQKSYFETPLVQWSVDPEDWKLRNADKVAAAVLGTVRPGDIILLHDSHGTSVDAAFQIVDALQAQGYAFVTVEELLSLGGITTEAGKFYSRVR
jgi:peptidoglycan/xylan/chitin deacetylase (PgdA/CDA1 family)